jgi:hypothetical protein
MIIPLLALTLHATPSVHVDVAHDDVPIDPWATSSLIVAGVGGATGVTAGIGGIVLAGRSNGLKSAIAKFDPPTPDQAALIALKKHQVAGTTAFVESFGAASAASFVVAGGLFLASLALE